MLFSYSRFMDMPVLLLLFPTPFWLFTFLRTYSSDFINLRNTFLKSRDGAK